MKKDNLEIDLLEYWNVLMKRRRMIVVTTVIGAVLGIVYSLSLPRYYEATAKIMSITGPKSGNMMNLNLLGAGGLGVGGNTENRKFIAIVKSRSLARIVIEKMNLMPHLFEAQWDSEKKEWKGPKPPPIESGVDTLTGLVSAAEDQNTSLVNVSAEFKDPEIAAKIANQYTESLQVFLNNNNLTTEKRYRIFIEQQLNEIKTSLLIASRELAKFYSSKDISSVKSVIDVNLNKYQNDTLVTVPMPRGPSGNQNSELDGQSTALDEQSIVKDVPANVYLTYLVKSREGLGAFRTTLEEQLAFARLDEAREDLAFHVIDKAEPNPIPVRPRRRMITTLSTLSAFMIACLSTMLLAYKQTLIAQREK